MFEYSNYRDETIPLCFSLSREFYFPMVSGSLTNLVVKTTSVHSVASVGEFFLRVILRNLSNR